MIGDIEAKGASVAAIVCLINRSSRESFCGIPVVSVLYLPTPEYSQDDPLVINLVQEGKVVWKPKAEWSKLKAAMENNKN
jgi:hypothetical protein